MKKEGSITVHTMNGRELVFTNKSFDYCYGNSKGSIISIGGDQFEIIEHPSVVSKLLEREEEN